MITEKELRNEIVGQFVKGTEDAGFLTALGAKPISYEVDKLKNITLGGSSTVREGGKKPLTASGTNELEIMKAKQTVALVVTDETFEYVEGSDNVDLLVSHAVSRLVADMDLAITLGRSRDNGELITAFDDFAIVPNATEVMLPTLGDPTTTDAAILAAFSSGVADNSVALSLAGYNAIAYKTNANMQRVYPEADKNNIFSFFGQDALLVKSLGYNMTDGNGKNAMPNDILAVSGDFGNVYRGVTDVQIRKSNDGILAGTNLLEENATGFIIELFYSFGIENLNEFSVITNEVDAGE